MSAQDESKAASPIAPRFSVVSFNIWNEMHFQEREKALSSFFSCYDADIICLQEVRPSLLKFVDEMLPEHSRIVPTEKDPQGWTVEGNIYFNEQLFALQSYGTQEIGHEETHRRLFWAVLASRFSTHSVLVCNVHMTWEGNDEEVASGLSPRVSQSREILDFLSRKHSEVSAVVLCGDFNDRYHPRKLFAQDGFIDTFSQVSQPLRSTWPTPSWNWVEIENGGADNPCDFIFTCPGVKTLGSYVVEHSHKGVYPSDHFPITAMLQFKNKDAKAEAEAEA